MRYDIEIINNAQQIFDAILGIETDENKDSYYTISRLKEDDQINFYGNCEALLNPRFFREILENFDHNVFFQLSTADVDLTNVITLIQCSAKGRSKKIHFANGIVNNLNLNTSKLYQISFINVTFNNVNIVLSNGSMAGNMDDYTFNLFCTFDGCKFNHCTFSCNKPYSRYSRFSVFEFFGHDSQCDLSDNKFDVASAEDFYTKFHDWLPTSKSLPSGEFIMYKKVIGMNKKTDDFDYYVIELAVPKDAKRIMSLSQCVYPINSEYKLRVSKAKMTGVAYKINASGNLKKITNAEINNLTFASFFSHTFKYSTGKIIKPEKPFDLNLFDACTSGIHGFLNINLAKNYRL